MGENNSKGNNDKELILKNTNNLYNLIPENQTTQSRSGKGTWRDISPKKTYRWLTITLKDTLQERNYNEIPPHTSQNGHHQKVYKQ